MAKDELPEKKVPIRPRDLKEVEESSETEEGAEELTRLEKIRRTMLRQSGTKFPGREPTPRDSRRRRRSESSQPRESETPSKTQATTAREKPSQEAADPKPEATTKPTGPLRKRGENVWDAEVAPRDEVPEPPSQPTEKKAPIQIPWRLLWRRFVRLQVPAPWVVGGAVVLAAIAAHFGFRSGVDAEVQRTKALSRKESFSSQVEGLEQLNTALQNLREGNPGTALEILRRLDKPDVRISSLSYLTGLAALQAGDVRLAEQKIDESLAKGERVSDSLALQAVLETQKASDPSVSTFGDPRLKSEQYLRRAITADAANPYPMIELGTLLRYQRRTDEARELLEGAKARLQPVDSATVVDVSLALMKAEETATDQLSLPAEPYKDVTGLFASAYIALRLGQVDRAVEFLRIVRPQVSLDLFAYLINDPVFRRYIDEPKMKEFFE